MARGAERRGTTTPPLYVGRPRRHTRRRGMWARARGRDRGAPRRRRTWLMCAFCPFVDAPAAPPPPPPPPPERPCDDTFPGERCGCGGRCGVAPLLARLHAPCCTTASMELGLAVSSPTQALPRRAPAGARCVDVVEPNAARLWAESCGRFVAPSPAAAARNCHGCDIPPCFATVQSDRTERRARSGAEEWERNDGRPRWDTT